MSTKTKAKTSNNRVMLFIIVAVILIVIVSVVGRKKGEEQTELGGQQIEQIGEKKVISSVKMSQPKQYAGFEITDVKFEVRPDSLIDITANVVNNTGKDMTEDKWMTINVLDKEGKILNACGGSIGAIKNGESTKISSTFASNGEDQKAYNVEVVDYVDQNEARAARAEEEARQAKQASEDNN